MTQIKPINTTIEKTSHLLHKVMNAHDLIRDEHDAYKVLVAVITTLRDRLTPTDAHSIGAQLTPLVRGWYYEGWSPSHTPEKFHRQEFLAAVKDALPVDRAWPVEEVVRLVLATLADTIDPAALERLRDQLPADLTDLLL